LNLIFEQYDKYKHPIKQLEYHIEKDSYTSVDFTQYYGFIDKKCKYKRLRFFFINDSVMMKYSWADICKDQMYEKKILYSDKDIESCFRIIEYHH
jgi:hypothetical protein